MTPMEEADQRAANARKREKTSAQSAFMRIGMYDFLAPKVHHIPRKEVSAPSPTNPTEVDITVDESDLDDLTGTADW